MFSSHSRSLHQKLTYSCTLKFICVKLNHINVPNVQRLSPIQAIYRNTLAFIWASNRTVVKFVRENSPSCRTYNSTSEPILVTNPINAVILDAKKHFRNFPTCNLIQDVTKLTNPTNAIHAINASQMNRPCWNTFPSTKNPNI